MNIIRKNGDLLILKQDRGISATHPIIFKRKKEEIVVCSVSDKKRYNYSIILPRIRVKNWDSNDPSYFLQCINSTKYFLNSAAGHELTKEHGISEDLIRDVKKYIEN